LISVWPRGPRKPVQRVSDSGPAIAGHLENYSRTESGCSAAGVAATVSNRNRCGYRLFGGAISGLASHLRCGRRLGAGSAATIRRLLPDGRLVGGLLRGAIGTRAITSNDYWRAVYLLVPLASDGLLRE